MSQYMSEPLRPLTLGEILDRTAQLYRGNFLSFVGVATVPTVVILAAFIPIIAIVAFFGVARAKGVPPLSIGLIALIVTIGIVAILAASAATVFAQAGLIRLAIGAQMGQKLKIRDALKSVWPRFGRFLGVLSLQVVFVALIPMAIAGVAIGLLFLLLRLMDVGTVASGATVGAFTFLAFAVAGVVIVVRAMVYSLALPASVAEDKPAWDSLQRSVKLSRGTRGRIFLMFLLVWALSMVVSMIGYVPMMIVMAIAAAMGPGARSSIVLMVVAEIINILVNFALQTLIPPVYITALVLFYYDQRIRTEGYDIEWMMERAGLTGAAVAPGQSAIAAGPVADPGAVNP
jgi:hypothetical protein